MKSFIDGQGLANHFNENETVWREYEHLRQLRRRCRLTIPLPSDCLDRLDRLRAERKIRILSCIGKGLP
ncbi:MAG: hypothetical protein OEY86_18195 [Nitrospira sp.]|nr:hypothetical protein [Nitrospira sp.]